MDANKRQVLQDVGYRIQECCGTCLHGQFPPGLNFGVCLYHKYEHLKHSDKVRQLSVYQYGHCPFWEFNDRRLAELGGFQEFL